MDIREVLFIELYPNSCVKEVILREAMVQVERVFMEINLTMKISF